MAALAPLLDAIADPVDPGAGQEAVLGPLRLEFHLPRLLAGAGDGEEVPAFPSAVCYLVGNAVIREAEMPLRLVERRVQDWIFDDDGRHGSSIRKR